MREVLANQVFRDFTKSNESLEKLDSCFSDESEKASYQLMLMETALRDSVEFFRKSQSELIQKFAAQVFERTGGGQTFPFTLTGLHFGKSPANFRAGRAYATGSIYVDVSKVSYQDWYVVLAHELFHNLDSKTNEAIKTFSDAKTVERAVALASSHSSVKELGREDLDFIKTWIFAGLNKGLLAEYRAWVFTDELYRAGKKENLWPLISWLEDAIGGDDLTQEQRNRNILKELLRRKIDPKKRGPFKWPLIREVHQLIISELNAQVTAP